MKKIYGHWITATIASGETSSDEIDIGDGYEQMQLRLPALTSGTLKLQVSNESGGTFQDLGLGIATSTTTGAYNDVWEIGGWRFLKIVSSAEQAAARTIYVRGVRIEG